MVARGDGLVNDGVGADEADLDLVVAGLVLGVIFDLEVRNLACLWWLGLIGGGLCWWYWRVLCVLVVRPSPSSSSSTPPSAASPSTSAPSASVAVTPGS